MILDILSVSYYWGGGGHYLTDYTHYIPCDTTKKSRRKFNNLGMVDTQVIPPQVNEHSFIKRVESCRRAGA